MRDEHDKVVGYRQLDRIGQTLAPILIRRSKAQVLTQLPARLDKNLFVPMTPEQRTHHEENREAVARIVAKWRRYKFLSEADQRRLMIALQNMRMSCDSTYLLDHATDRGVKADELLTLLGETLEAPGTKVVIFSQWLRMHELLVEKTTTAIAGPVVAEGAGGEGAPAAAPGEQPRPAAATSDSWETFVRTGLTLLEQLAAVSRAPSSAPGPGGLRFVRRDPDTGQDYLRIPMPSADVFDRALKAIGQLLGPGNA